MDMAAYHTDELERIKASPGCDVALQQLLEAELKEREKDPAREPGYEPPTHEVRETHAAPTSRDPTRGGGEHPGASPGPSGGVGAPGTRTRSS